MRTLFEHSILAGIGLLSMTHDKALKIVNELSQEGDIQKDEAQDWVGRLIQRGDEERESMRKLVRDEVKSVLAGLNLATKQDLKDFTARMEAQSKQTKT